MKKITESCRIKPATEEHSSQQNLKKTREKHILKNFVITVAITIYLLGFILGFEKIFIRDTELI